MSAKHVIDTKDAESALRHTVFPLLAGAAVVALQAGLEVFNVETFNWQTTLTVIYQALGTALLAGLARLIQRKKLTL